MQLKIQMVEEAGAKSVNKATIRTYDTQGIMMEEQVLESAGAEGKGSEPGQKGAGLSPQMGQEGADPSAQETKQETQIDVPMNGRVEIKNVGEPPTVDPSQKAAVPDSPEEVDRRVKEEQRRKDAMDPYPHTMRSESYMRAQQERGGQAAASPPPGGFPPAHGAKAEKEGSTADLSKNVDSSPKEKDDKKR